MKNTKGGRASGITEKISITSIKGSYLNYLSKGETKTSRPRGGGKTAHSATCNIISCQGGSILSKLEKNKEGRDESSASEKKPSVYVFHREVGFYSIATKSRELKGKGGEWDNVGPSSFMKDTPGRKKEGMEEGKGTLVIVGNVMLGEAGGRGRGGDNVAGTREGAGHYISRIPQTYFR